MARIIENIENQSNKRRIIEMSAADVISIVQEYQNLKLHNKSYDEIKKILNKVNLFIVEDI